MSGLKPQLCVMARGKTFKNKATLPNVCGSAQTPSQHVEDTADNWFKLGLLLQAQHTRVMPFFLVCSGLPIIIQRLQSDHYYQRKRWRGRTQARGRSGTVSGEEGRRAYASVASCVMRRELCACACLVHVRSGCACKLCARTGVSHYYPVAGWLGRHQSQCVQWQWSNSGHSSITKANIWFLSIWTQVSQWGPSSCVHMCGVCQVTWPWCELSCNLFPPLWQNYQARFCVNPQHPLWPS